MGFVRSPPPPPGADSRMIKSRVIPFPAVLATLISLCSKQHNFFVVNVHHSPDPIRPSMWNVYVWYDSPRLTLENGLTPSHPPPKNHGPFRRYLPAITKVLRIGQDSGQYMIINAGILVRWKNDIGSPLGAGEKKDVDPSDEVRLIHDLSFPKGDAVNDAFQVDSVPKLRFKSVAAIARRIGLNWVGSPPCYCLFGLAISWLMGNKSSVSLSDPLDYNPFFPFEWVDGHVLVEPDIEDRLNWPKPRYEHTKTNSLNP
ncbi:Hypothetical protein PHPALM_19633 [Phytophthora palmivora]|uniref:Uncharacterized protein n=1 Tax=Phytophthora palmivora TaxID=4796 RepID=A0A2P4XH00_9STRA|nr:Hypothetical protein PHPALM_19633 [Phytophthora palmivora]